jgi:large subunit ribosomal protein L28
VSRKCIVCGKNSKSGNTVSYSNKASKRIFKPNIQSLNIFLNGKKTRELVCTSCIKSDRIKKAI